MSEPARRQKGISGQRIMSEPVLFVEDQRCFKHHAVQRRSNHWRAYEETCPSPHLSNIERRASSKIVQNKPRSLLRILLYASVSLQTSRFAIVA